jgi:hypothetical protein
MTANSNTFNAIELTDTDLEHVTGGDAVIAGPAINPVLQKAEQELKDAYLKNHPIHLGTPFSVPNTPVPTIPH